MAKKPFGDRINKIFFKIFPKYACPEKKHLVKPTSLHALLHHVEQMIFQIILKILYKRLKLCAAFSLALDESTDISDTVELAICIRVVTVGYDVAKKVLRHGKPFLHNRRTRYMSTHD